MRTLLLALALFGAIDRFDHDVQQRVQAGRRSWLERPMRLASDLGRPVVVIAGLGAILMFDRVQGPVTVATAVLAVLPTNLLVEILKRATFRPRPDGEHKRSNASFPSSHAANAFALAAVLARRWRRSQAVFWVAAALVAWSRVYLNRHFLGDVLVAGAIGAACGWLAWRIVQDWQRRRARRRVAEAAHRPPDLEPESPALLL